MDYDVCIVGSGAGAGPVAYTLAKAGYSMVVLEKGKWFAESGFSKDELKNSLRNAYSSNLREEYHMIEDQDEEGNWVSRSTYESGNSFWNGNVVGGSSNFMSGFFHRLKPKDFRLLSEFGTIESANIVDWPISYEELEPYYAKVEAVVGVSGAVTDHPFQEPRSTGDYPFPPTAEHPITSWFDKTCEKLGYHSIKVPRAVLSVPALNRNSCVYSDYCGSYACDSRAKGSSRVALLNPALLTGKCKILSQSFVYKLQSDARGKVVAAHYYDKDGNSKQVTAKIFVVAALAPETSRLLLLSEGEKHPHGLANNNGQVGRNLIFSAGGSGMGFLPYKNYTADEVTLLKTRGLFVNRALEDWYFIDKKEFGKPLKGGMIEFMMRHANPVAMANSEKWGEEGLLWGARLKRRLKKVFSEGRFFKFEIFNDWLPTDNCFVELDKQAKDKWGLPVGKIRIGYHRHDLKIGNFLAEKSERVLQAMGAEEISSGVSGFPPSNLVAGGCRFGDDAKTSVLDKNCRAHDVENLYVTDGSFMPTGGSVPYTWTIYANSFRVADKIIEHLG